MSAEERERAKRAIMSVLASDAQYAYERGMKRALALPPALAMMMRMTAPEGPSMDEHLAALQTQQERDEHWARMQQDEAEHEHSEECTGRCGALWYFGELAEIVMDCMASDSERVERLLSEMGVPPAEAQ